MTADRVIRLYGANEALVLCRDPECVLSGPAGTGKTIACLLKLFLLAEKYAGCRLLIARKTRESLTEAALVSWEEKVVPPGHPCLAGPQRNFRQNYQFPNGSVVVVGGLDKAQKIMSTEYDAVYVQEAIELTEHDWESLTTRLRNGVVPYQQILADTNPDRPKHWLKKRSEATPAKDGKPAAPARTTMLESRHEDNPAVIDRATGRPTAAGAVYLSKLDALTGPRKDRLRYGRWVQAEGVVYEAWDEDTHLIPRFPIPADWPRFLSVDFGFTNPFACGWWARDPDGRLYLYREIYKTGRTVAQHARTILRAVEAWDPRHGGANWHYATEPIPSLVICDHADAEGRATLEAELRLGTVAADKAISAGVQAVGERLQKQGDGKPRLFVLRDSLVERDEELWKANQPTSIVDEFGSYVWPKGGDGKSLKEVPVDACNHAMDQMRYLVQTLATRGFVPLAPDTVSVGGGLVESGYRGVAAGRRRDDDEDESSGSIFGNLFGGV